MKTTGWGLKLVGVLLFALPAIGYASAPEDRASVPVSQGDKPMTKPIDVFQHGPGPKRPDPPRTFEPGPPILPAVSLIEWLNHLESDKHNQDRHVKLPVVIRLDKDHTRIVEAFIGVTDETDAETTFLRLNDSMMGVSLMDRLRERCLSATSPCVVWLEGHWGDIQPAGIRIPKRDEPEGGPTRWPFYTVGVHERIEAGADGTRVRAQLEVHDSLAEFCHITTVRLEVAHLFVPTVKEMKDPHARPGGWLDYYSLDWVDDGVNGEYIVRKGNRSVHPAPGDPRYNRLVIKEPAKVAQFLNRLVDEYHVLDLSTVKYEGQAEHETTVYTFFLKDSCNNQNRLSYWVKDGKHGDPKLRALVEALDEFFKTPTPTRAGP